MASSSVAQLSTDGKRYQSTLASHKAIPGSSLALDLRFEQTYLKSIAPYVRSTAESKGVTDPQTQPLQIKWGMVIWITTRDQLLAPLFQGVIWGNLYPWVQYFRGGFAPSSTHGRPSGTGAGIAKLKSWLSSVLPPTTSFRTR